MVFVQLEKIGQRGGDHRASNGNKTMPRRRRKIDAQLKAQIVLEAVQGRSSIAELAQKFEVHQNQIYTWRRLLEDQAARIFERGPCQDKTRQIEELRAKIGELTIERDRLKSRGEQRSGVLKRR
jgi:transposase